MLFSLIYTAFLIISFSLSPETLYANSRVYIKATWYKAAPGSTHLEPAIFLPQKYFLQIKEDFDVKEGDPIEISHANKTITARFYKSTKTIKMFQMRHSLGQKLGLKKGQNELIFSKITSSDAQIPSRPLYPHFESYPGTIQWQGYAIGAPHGDCDWHTGEIVKLVAKKYGIPGTAAYGCRFPYRGVWFDCNRPFMKRKTQNGVSSQRMWSQKSQDVYDRYQRKILSNTDNNKKRFKVFTSFHGHDLTVTTKSGKRIPLNAIEAVASGLSIEQIQKLKQFISKKLKQHFKNPPKIYFANLKKDQIYRYKGIPHTFYYTATGTRLTGSLRSDLTEIALHFETPNSMRISSAVRNKTADILAAIYKFLKQNAFTKLHSPESSTVEKQFDVVSNEMLTIEQGNFKMGSNSWSAWTSEKPRHQVFLSSYQIKKYEVTNKEFVSFLNKSLQSKKITFNKGIIYSLKNKKIWMQTKLKKPLAQIFYKNKKFKVMEGKENFPVFYVSYYGATAYAKYHKQSLPTEAQWEKAASWDPEKNYKYKYATNSNLVLPNLANFENSQDPYENQTVSTSPIGAFTNGSPYKIKDMSGNVWEWTSDFYADKTYKSRSRTTKKDPKGPQVGTLHTIRGGAWNSLYSSTRSTIRLGIPPEATLINVGFRTVKNH